MFDLVPAEKLISIFNYTNQSKWTWTAKYIENVFKLKDVHQLRNCALLNLNDLDCGKEYVRQKIVDYGNDLLGLGKLNIILIIDFDIDMISFIK